MVALTAKDARRFWLSVLGMRQLQVLRYRLAFVIFSWMVLGCQHAYSIHRLGNFMH